MTEGEQVLRFVPDPARQERMDLWIGDTQFVFVQRPRSVIFGPAGRQEHLTLVVGQYRMTVHETTRGRASGATHGFPLAAIDFARMGWVAQRSGFVAEWRDTFLDALQRIASPDTLEAQGVRYLLPFPDVAHWSYAEQTGAFEYRPLAFVTTVRAAWPFPSGSAFLAHGGRGGWAGAVFVGERRGRVEPWFIRALDIIRLAQRIQHVFTSPHDRSVAWLTDRDLRV